MNEPVTIAKINRAAVLVDVNGQCLQLQLSKWEHGLLLTFIEKVLPHPLTVQIVFGLQLVARDAEEAETE